MFVDATPGDKLLKMLKHTEAKHRISDDFRIKFVSKAGIKLKSLLLRKHMRTKTCEENNGNPCVISNGKGIESHICTKNRVSYFSKCATCEKLGKCRVYYGETARNIHTRSQEHYNALKCESTSSFKLKHI